MFRSPSPKTFGAFSLIEITIALGIIAVAVIPMMGLLSVGLTNNRVNIDSSTRSQIVSWVEGDIRSNGDSASAVYIFDEFGLPTTAERTAFSATVTDASVNIPGSTSQVKRWSVVVTAPARNDQILGRDIVWGAKP